MLQATLVILAGGASRRMGRPKAELPVGGVTMLDWMLARLGPRFDEVLVATAAMDRHPGGGPLAGVEAGLLAARHETIFAVACDMPHVTQELAAELVASVDGHDAAVPLLGGRAEPACAAYRRSALAEITIALEEGRLKATAALSNLDVVYVEGLDHQLFRNVNTPSDYQEFIAALGRT